MIYSGSSKIKEIYVGSTKIKEAWLGAVRVFSSALEFIKNSVSSVQELTEAYKLNQQTYTFSSSQTPLCCVRLQRTSARFVVRPLRIKPTSLGFDSVVQ